MDFLALYNRRTAGIPFSLLSAFIISTTCLGAENSNLSSPETQSEILQIRKKTSKGNKSHGKFNAQEKARVEADHLKQTLSLSQEQTSKVFNVAVEKERDLNYLKYVRHLHHHDRVAKKDSIQSKYEGQLQTILTEEQFASYKSK